jgi:hypothetical protein
MICDELCDITVEILDDLKCCYGKEEGERGACVTRGFYTRKTFYCLLSKLKT